jgi:hypothetical protein
MWDFPFCLSCQLDAGSAELSASPDGYVAKLGVQGNVFSRSFA